VLVKRMAIEGNLQIQVGERMRSEMEREKLRCSFNRQRRNLTKERITNLEASFASIETLGEEERKYYIETFLYYKMSKKGYIRGSWRKNRLARKTNELSSS